MGISRHLDEIQLEFEVFGLRKNQWIPFSRNINYQAFIIKRKNINFDLWPLNNWINPTFQSFDWNRQWINCPRKCFSPRNWLRPMKCWQKAIGQLSNFFLKISSLIVFLCYFLLDQEVAKKSSRREKTTSSILRYRSSGHPCFLFLRKSRRGNARHLSLFSSVSVSRSSFLYSP